MLDEKDTEGRGFAGGVDGSDWVHRFFPGKSRRNEDFELSQLGVQIHTAPVIFLLQSNKSLLKIGCQLSFSG
jgi:hypothetical protein